ncbi:MAG: hypothetical protein VX278_20690 [Myxococcota bacterium]|nr:hypothetical protein [Myxococcota bacterium]
MRSEIIFVQGHVWSMSDLEERSVALDGAVQGPALDHKRQCFSFDHHKNCIRHVTLATCEQVRDAILLGADFEGFRIYLNDLDADSVLATWLLLNPKRLLASKPYDALQRLIHDIGRVDALGPSYGEEHLLSSWIKPKPTNPQDLSLLHLYLSYIDRYLEGDLGENPHLRGESTAVWYDPDDTLQQEKTRKGTAFLYRVAPYGLLYARAAHDTWSYTVGKRSDFVRFPIPDFLGSLNELEGGNVLWGGGSSIGGAPRHPNGARSFLSPNQVLSVFKKFHYLSKKS